VQARRIRLCQLAGADSFEPETPARLAQQLNVRSSYN